MLRFTRSLILGLLIGTVAGLYLGWFQFPAGTRSSELGALTRHYRDDYTVMIAAGYAADGDLPGALARLQLLDIGDVPTFLRQTTEGIINASSRDLRDIRLLVNMAEALGQLTAPMEPFLGLAGGET